MNNSAFVVSQRTNSDITYESLSGHLFGVSPKGMCLINVILFPELGFFLIYCFFFTTLLKHIKMSPLLIKLHAEPTFVIIKIISL